MPIEAKFFSMKIVTVLCGAMLACSVISCTKELSSTPQAVSEETVLSTEDSSDLIKSNAYLFDQEAVFANIVSNVGGYLLHKPAGYKTSTKNYPLLVCLSGSGNLGNGTTNLYKMTNNSVPKLIQFGKFPKSFTVNGKSYSFIVVAPQFKRNPDAADVNAVINYVVKKYRVDESRIYLTGLSLGGGTAAEFAAAYPNKVAAVVPMADSHHPRSTEGKTVATNKLPVWAFHNKGDDVVPYTNTVNFVNYINESSPAVPAKKTIFSARGHNCWTKATDPGYKENNMIIYQWMLQYKRQ